MDEAKNQMRDAEIQSTVASSWKSVKVGLQGGPILPGAFKISIDASYSLTHAILL